jgi:hypothetical protein
MCLLNLRLDGGLEELEEEFEGSKIQYAFARVIDPNSKLPKFVFISWVSKLVFLF